MKARTHKQDSLLIVYDADRIQHPDARLFDPEYWQSQGAVVGEAEGRGKALLLETGFAPAVLRRYLRGGWAARASQDRYVFSGYQSSRPVMEFNMLKKLSAAGLPVPEPLAAMCQRQGAFYTAWLMTRRIMDVIPLADVVCTRWDEPLLWRETGACVRRFHDFGLVHADLNARNILVGESNCIYLIDFDRARIRVGDSRAFEANLRRLQRSLEKLWPEPVPDGLVPCWRSLEEGYGKEPGAQ